MLSFNGHEPPFTLFNPLLLHPKTWTPFSNLAWRLSSVLTAGRSFDSVNQNSNLQQVANKGSDVQQNIFFSPINRFKNNINHQDTINDDMGNNMIGREAFRILEDISNSNVLANVDPRNIFHDWQSSF